MVCVGSTDAASNREQLPITNYDGMENNIFIFTEMFFFLNIVIGFSLLNSLK
jgi:hypothetical protein